MAPLWATSPTCSKNRRILGEEGPVSVIVVVDSSTGKPFAPAKIVARGFHGDEAIFDDLLPQSEVALQRAAANAMSDPLKFQHMVSRVVGKWVGDTHRRRPMIVSSVVVV